MKKEVEKYIDYKKLLINYDTYVWAFGEKAPKEDLEYLYCEVQLTWEEIAEVMHRGSSTIGRWIEHYGIRKPSVIIDGPKLTEDILRQVDWTRMSRNFIEKPWKKTDTPQYNDFYYLYIELNWSAKDIAQLLGRSRDAVQRILRKLNIQKPSVLAQQSRENMNLRSTGTRFPNASPEALEKKKNTNLSRYGETTVLKNKDYREGGMIRKYGKSYPQQVDSIRQKCKETNKSRYGKEYVFQTDEFKEQNKQKMLEEYGVDNYAKTDKFKKQMNDVLEKYGEQYDATFTAISQVPHVKERAIQTNTEKYGVKYATQASEVKKARKETFKSRYGVEWMTQHSAFVKKAQQTLKERYGVTGTSQLHIKHKKDMNKEFWLSHFLDKRSGAFDVAKCAQYHGIRDGAVLTWKRKLGINIRNKGGSVIEGDIAGLLSQWGIEAETKNRHLLGKSSKEIDIYLPKFKVGIEYDGLLFHSQGSRDYGRIKNMDINHLQNKYNEAVNNNIKLFNIFETEWRNPVQNKIWQAILKRSVKLLPSISLDYCVPIMLDVEIADEFLEENSLEVYEQSNISIGLTDGITLYAVAQFKEVNPAQGKWQVVRFAVNNGYNVAGALNELINKFLEENLDVTELACSADLRYADLDQYEQTICTFTKKTTPFGYLFKTIGNSRVKDLTLITLSSYDKSTAEEELGYYDDKLTVVENFYANDYRSIYDCGRAIYKYSVE